MTFALVTGASGGIGLSISTELAKRGKNLILVARSEDKLKSIAADLASKYSVSVEYFTADLSAEGAVASLHQRILEKGYAIDTLINNAGYGVWGAVADRPWQELRNMMQLNMIAVAELCHAFIPELKKNTKAHILNIASTAAYQAVPTLSAYAASKSFVVLFSRGLRRELKNTPITVTCVSPGATSTNFIDRAGMDALKERAEKFSMSADAVATIAVNAMYAGKAEVVTGFLNWLSVQLTYFLPKSIPEKIAEGLYITKD